MDGNPTYFHKQELNFFIKHEDFEQKMPVFFYTSFCSLCLEGSKKILQSQLVGQLPWLHAQPYQDTAEYGLGMALGSQQRRERLVEDVKELLEEVPVPVFWCQKKSKKIISTSHRIHMDVSKIGVPPNHPFW